VTPVTESSFVTGASAAAMASWNALDVASASGFADSKTAMNAVRPAP
jgi:hypothetical protein